MGTGALLVIVDVRGRAAAANRRPPRSLTVLFAARKQNRWQWRVPFVRMSAETRTERTRIRLYFKLALGNVRRSARDYSVYFITLGFAACLLYSFVGSMDHLRAMGLSPDQMGVLGSAGDVLEAFSIFTVLMFLFLVRYANRFLLRRRKREFALYELCGMGRGAVAAVLVGVWGACLFQPVYFIAFIIPMGFAACFATSLVARLGVAGWAERARRRPERYLSGLRAFTVRQVEGRVSSTSMALACVCVLIAVAVCMMVAGFVFSVGLRSPEMLSSGVAASMAPIGYIGIFYGSVFLLSAVAVLVLQQLSGAADSRRAYGVLDQLGCERALMRSSLRRQICLYFAAPMAGALVHDVFGLFLVAFLAFAIGSSGFASIVAGVLAFTIGLMAVYALVTAHAVERAMLCPIGTSPPRMWPRYLPSWFPAICRS